jgi:hypothetical protein
MFCAIAVYLACAAVIEAPDRVGYLALMVFAIFAAAVFWNHMRNALDEVYDCDDSLLVRRDGREERIKLTSIKAVEVAYRNPPFITLELDKPGRFGASVWFFPPNEPYPAHRFAKKENLVGDDLVARVERARAGHRTPH